MITEVIVPGSDTSIAIALHTLSFDDETVVDILVNRAERDEITESIAAKSYSFPYPFHLLSRFARPGQRVLDLGAHIGTFSLFAAKLGYEVAAVEASPRNAVLLQASAKQNHFDKLHIISAAVSDRAGTLDFIEAGPYGLISTAIADAPTISVPAISVDEILAELGWDRVDFIKMDVEGSEVKAIAGMHKLLSRADAPNILFESNGHTLHLFNETPNRLMAALETLGYTCYLVEPGQLTPLRPSELLFPCTVDCLATKTPLNSQEGWRIGSPLSREIRISHILSMATNAHPHLRSYLARTLRDGEFRLLSDHRVLWALEKLTNDADTEVCADAAWFPVNKFRLPLSRKYKKIALLQRYIALASYLLQRGQYIHSDQKK